MARRFLLLDSTPITLGALFKVFNFWIIALLSWIIPKATGDLAVIEYKLTSTTPYKKSETSEKIIPKTNNNSMSFNLLAGLNLKFLLAIWEKRKKTIRKITISIKKKLLVNSI